MPDRRRHRGAHPRDAGCFAPEALRVLRRAAQDLAWLLSRGYSGKAAVGLVGDRYSLRERQRKAIRRSTVGDAVRSRRMGRRIEPESLGGRPLFIDGYNVLLSVESALSGGIVLGSRDTAFRDMASMGGHYKRVQQTTAALELIGAYLHEIGCARAAWYLDRPISNSGRLKKLMQEIALRRGWPWTVELVASPDRVLAATDEVVATADGWILDQGGPWLNLARLVIERDVPGAWVVDLFAADRGDVHP